MRKLSLLTIFLLVSQLLRATDFPIVTPSRKASIYYDPQGPKLDSISAHLLADDIERISGYRPVVLTDLTKAIGNIILIASIESPMVQSFLKASDTLQKLKGKWECYGYAVKERPSPGIEKILLITGSDKRGTAYGVFALSERLGVSPWYWWADVPVKKQSTLVLEQQVFLSSPPSVKYRGIFINDEDWGLQPWAAKTFEPETKDIGPKTYAKVFELLLRLKANLLWPAMHPSTRAFYHYPLNPVLANDFGIVVGSSHAEPMLRNNVDEWKEKEMGDFNYLTNKRGVYSYWEKRVQESAGKESVYTMGMRGVHDSGIEGVKTPEEAARLLERIIEDQRGLLKKYIDTDVTSIPQVFTAYKEVLDIYDNGLKLPEDLTLVWPDDNYGYIQRLDGKAEQNRSGGSGVYYHASYWGRPHDYLWLGTTHPALMREEMVKAYENGARTLWVLNVGDIKPLEYSIQQFLDMAFEIVPFENPKYCRQHLAKWTGNLFGKKNSELTAAMLWEYYRLAFERRPEFMGWSQTEPTTQTNLTGYNPFYYGDQGDQRIKRYESLERSLNYLRNQVDTNAADAFYELVYYPVRAASLMNKKFLYRDKAILYGKQGRLSARDYALWSDRSYDSIQLETDYYNRQLAAGKWNGILSMKPRDLPVYAAPVLSIPLRKTPSEGAWDLSEEGADTIKLDKAHELPAFYTLSKETRFFDLFLTDSLALRWKATVSKPYIILSTYEGNLLPAEGHKEQRVRVWINWKKAPNLKEIKEDITIVANGVSRNLLVLVQRPEFPAISQTGRFVEENGWLSIHLQHYSRKTDKGTARWQLVRDLGHTGAVFQSRMPSISVSPSTTDTALIRKNAPVLEYDFVVLSQGAPQVYIYGLPVHPLNSGYGVRFAVVIDNDSLHILDYRTYGRSEEWKQNVLSNTSVKSFRGPYLKPGKHTVKIYAMDPGVLIERLVMDMGGLKRGYGVIGETILWPE